MSCFYPHSLGHFIGLYTHDVGPCAWKKDKDGKDTEVPSCRSIMQNMTLEQGMCLTVEPGIYFHHVLIDKYRADAEKSKYFNFELVDAYTHVGGIRIEDDILVTDDGFENMSIAPRTVEEVEAFMKKE